MKSTSIIKILLITACAVALSSMAASNAYAPPMPTYFTVDNTTDAHDETPGDGFCDTNHANGIGNGPCTLRAAIEEANASADADIIDFHSSILVSNGKNIVVLQNRM